MKNIIMHARIGALCFAIYKDKKQMAVVNGSLVKEFFERLKFMNHRVLDDQKDSHLYFNGSLEKGFRTFERGN